MEWKYNIEGLTQDNLSVMKLPKLSHKVELEYPEESQTLRYNYDRISFEFALTVLGIRMTIRNTTQDTVLLVDREHITYRSPLGRELAVYGKALLDAIRNNAVYDPDDDFLPMVIPPKRSVIEILVPADLVKFYREYIGQSTLMSAIMWQPNKGDYYTLEPFLGNIRKLDDARFDLLIPVKFEPQSVSEDDKKFLRNFVFTFRIREAVREQKTEDKQEESSKEERTQKQEKPARSEKRQIGFRTDDTKGKKSS